MPSTIQRSELLKKRLDAFTRVLNGVEQGDVRALHRARVASRRLRELIPLMQLDDRDARKLMRRLRQVTNRLGAVRELDVLLLSIDELHVSRRARGSALGRVGVIVAKDRDRARKRLAREMPLNAVRRLVRKLDRVVDRLRLSEASVSRRSASSWVWALDARVARRATQLGDSVREAGAVYLPERLHRVRIALKKLRYGLELANDAAAEPSGADARVLKRGQDLLGRMHDLQVLSERVRQVQASLAPTTLSEWRDLDALIVSLEDDCRRLHARYMRLREPLSAIAERLGARAASPSPRAAARRAG